MKRFLMILALLFITIPAMAKTIPVEAMNDFSTERPLKTMSIKILQDIVVDSNLTFETGYIVKGEIVDVTDPKRLKRDAAFTFIPLSYTNLDGITVDIKGYYPAKYTTKFDKGQLAKTAALSVGNYFIKGLSMGYSAVEGAIKNEQDNRLKSSVTEVYEKSPLSYVERGEEIVIEKNQSFYLNFKVKGEDDIPNYEYKIIPQEN